MPWTKKQVKFFQAVAGGMKPKEGKLSPEKAKELLKHKGIVNRAMGGREPAKR